MNLKTLKEYDKLIPIDPDKLKVIKAGVDSAEIERRLKILFNN